jgi:hypothetical protein
MVVSHHLERLDCITYKIEGVGFNHEGPIAVDYSGQTVSYVLGIKMEGLGAVFH